MSEVPEKSLERYDVLDRIAVGGMAEVFLAKAYGAHGFEKTLAIKRILPELARDPEFEDRFIAEAKVAVQLSHTNVVQVFDFGRFAGSLFIAMEYVDGLDLAALLRRLKDRGTKIPMAAAFQIAIDIARGLDFAHQHGVVHRDVSPSNILLSRAGEVKIADFGIAIAANPSRGAPGNRKKVMGKWRYMSPEQSRGETVDTRSDLFSAAAVMYELFTSEKLFPGDEAEDIIDNIQHMQLPRPSQVRKGIPPRLDDILHQALARLPEQRPSRPAMMLRALTELTYESSIVATALDVAEIVSEALDTATPTGKRLDAIIRAQLANLAAEPSQHRRTARGDSDRGAASEAAVDPDRETAVTIMRRSRRSTSESPAVAAATGGSGYAHARDPADDSVPVLLSTVGSDGLTRLELDETTQGVAPWRPPGPLRQGTEPEPAKVVAPSASLTAGLPAQRDGVDRRLVLAGAAIALALGALAVVKLRGGPAPAPVAAAPIDAAPAPPPAPVARPAILVVESVPPGARGTLTGASWGARAIGPTPVTLEVPADEALVLRLELAGFRVYTDEQVAVAAGKTLQLRTVMLAAGARLVITSEPPGADVTIDGARVGVTPLTLDDQPPHQARIGLSRAGFVTVNTTVTLSAGREAKVARTLRAAPPPMGMIALQITDSWGEVFLGSKKIGRAPSNALRLPLGRHRLKIVNPPTGRAGEIDVEVVADEKHFYQVKLR